MDKGKVSIDQDARKLLWVIAIFNWTSLLLLSSAALVDYMAFFSAGHLVASGQRHNLFDFAAQSNFQTLTTGKPGVLPFYHLAYESLIFVPLSKLSFTNSLWIWRLALIVLILKTCSVLRKLFDLSFSDSFLIVVSFLSTAESVAQGQDSLVLLWIIASVYWLLINKRDAFAGGLLACGFFKPQLVIPIAAALMWKRGARFRSAFCAGVVVVLVLSTLVTGPDAWVQWLQLVNKAASEGGVEIGASAGSMANLRGLAQLVTSNHRLAVYATAVTTLCVCVATVWGIRSATTVHNYLPPAVAMALLVSYHSNIHDLALLLIPIMVLVSSLEHSAPEQVCIGLGFALPVFLITGMMQFFSIVVIALWAFTLRAREASPRA